MPILRKRTNSALSGEVPFDPRDRISTTTIFRSLESIPRDAGRPGLARTSCIQVYKTPRALWAKYSREHEYANSIPFDQVCSTLETIMKSIV